MSPMENFLSLAKTQRRIAHQYRRWALADEAAGKAERGRKYRAEYQRLWDAAKWHLARARMFQH